LQYVREKLEEARRILAERPELAERLRKRPRKALIRVGEEELLLDTATLEELDSGEPDIVLETDEETFWSIVKGELDAGVAYLSGRVRVKASLADKVYFGKVIKAVLEEKA